MKLKNIGNFSLTNFFGIMKKGYAVYNVLNTQIPKALRDNKITIYEMADIFVKIMQIFGIDLSVHVESNVIESQMKLFFDKPSVTVITDEDD